MLSTMLAVTFSQRRYVVQLKKESEMIQEMNQAFLDRSVPLKLVSFYESTATRIGVSRLEIRH
jgi:hypothetical protein